MQTPRARSKIRQWFSRERRVDAIDARPRRAREGAAPRGAAGAEAGLGRRRWRGRRAAALRRPRGAVRRDRRGPRVGQGRRAAHPARAARRRGAAPDHRRPPAAGAAAAGAPTSASTSRASTTCMVRLSRCCTPVPGDEIMGFVTRGRGVSVHRTDCANAREPARRQADRVIEVEWDNDAPGNYVGVGRDRGARPLEAAPRRRRRALGAPREHHLVHVADPDRPDRAVPLRLRARRSRPPRLDPGRGEAGRLGLRRARGAARRPQPEPPAPARHAVSRRSGATAALKRFRPDRSRSSACRRPARTRLGTRRVRRGSSPTCETRSQPDDGVHHRRSRRRDDDPRRRVPGRRRAVRERDPCLGQHAPAGGRRAARDPTMEKVRGPAADPTKFTTIADGQTITTQRQTVNGLQFTITQDMQWVGQSSPARAPATVGLGPGQYHDPAGDRDRSRGPAWRAPSRRK